MQSHIYIYATIFVLMFSVVTVCKAGNATDGVTLINQDKHTTFPIIINQSGSYRLSSNLTVPADTNGIVIQADNVTLDLNGFSITGNGSGEGITDNGTAHKGISVRNGTVVNFHFGINLRSSNQSDVEQIRALNNDHAGILVGDSSIVSGNVASGNGASVGNGVGINTGAFTTISRNNTSNNHGDGIGASSDDTIVENTSSGNTANGIDVTPGCTISGNTTDANGGIGIVATNGDGPNNSTISGNTAYLNGTAGIFVNCPANLVGNTALGNASGSNNISTNGSGCTRANNNPAP